ncbi:hypothetical protein E1B03_25800 [Citrobacter arsenatis]|uniref:Uncharacterized protein n=1 Tax=Citrobacter arsenatis TaxID=2546350 RepID=A0A4P6WR45_9ENTR|nr:hypothetical protein [Citrobacter arsenatis]QBM25664.1 hypothetical protein E1B03_25800 [Citrobacter arsenatis]
MNSLTTGKHARVHALRLGYEEFPDENAYGGAYYIKDGLKWIFTIVGLKKHLGIYNDDDLRNEKYDVDTYYRLESEDNEMQSLYDDLKISNSEPVYLEGGMYLYPDGSIR